MWVYILDTCDYCLFNLKVIKLKKILTCLPLILVINYACIPLTNVLKPSRKATIPRKTITSKISTKRIELNYPKYIKTKSGIIFVLIEKGSLFNIEQLVPECKTFKNDSDSCPKDDPFTSKNENLVCKNNNNQKLLPLKKAYQKLRVEWKLLFFHWMWGSWRVGTDAGDF